jgi:hypothetical protein
MRVCRNWRSLPLTVGSPSVCRYSSFSAQRHLVPLEPLPVLEQAIGGGDDREDRHHGAEHVHGERARERQDLRFAVQACVQDLPSAVLRRARLCVESDVTAS